MTTEPAHIEAIDFETIYLRLRQMEGRVYSDEELMLLPLTSRQHPHYREWVTRMKSAQKLARYIHSHIRGPHILEIGCGNGWLCHRLAEIPGSKVIGTDVNFPELQQAARVFQNVPNLHFIYTDISTGTLKEHRFDIIVFAASIQYFEDVDKTIADTMKLLKAGGEIHIIDSPFYNQSEISAARHRSRVYYEQAGFPAMANCYFHHSLEDLMHYRYEILYDPKKFLNRYLHARNPLYWIRIKND